MKISTKHLFAPLLASLIFSAPATAGMPSDLAGSLRSVRTPELPAKAASILESAVPSDRPAVGVEVLRSAMKISPALAPATVGAMARTSPETAPLLAGTAAAALPRQAADFARAAATAAPSHVTEIVGAVVRAVPSDYARIANSVVQTVPGSDVKVINGLKALPNLKRFIEHLAQNGGQSFNAPAVVHAAGEWVKVASRSLKMKPGEFVTADLNQEQVTAASSEMGAMDFTTMSFPFTIGAPFTPGGGTPGEINRPITVEVTPGTGRNYSRP